VVILPIAILLAIILYLLFFIWDYMHDPATIPEKIGIRISFIMFAFCTSFFDVLPDFSSAHAGHHVLPVSTRRRHRRGIRPAVHYERIQHLMLSVSE